MHFDLFFTCYKIVALTTILYFPKIIKAFFKYNEEGFYFMNVLSPILF